VKKKKKLKAYTGFNRNTGPGEGAVLIFDYTGKEARRLAFGLVAGHLVNEWIEFAVRRLPNVEWIMRQATSKNPHVIEWPETCSSCGMWGYEQKMVDGERMCEYCQEWAEE